MVVPLIWHWTPDRYRLAKHIAEGDTYREAGRKVNLAEATVKNYMFAVTEFRAYVDKITLENEMASRAGIIRRLMRGAKDKESSAATDTDTYLDYLKTLSKETKNTEESVTDLEVTFN